MHTTDIVITWYREGGGIIEVAPLPAVGRTVVCEEGEGRGREGGKD